MNVLNEVDKQYIAKIVDTKGSLHETNLAQVDLSGNYLTTMRFRLIIMDKITVDRIAEITGVGKVRGPLFASTNKIDNGKYEWSLQKKQDMKAFWHILYYYLSNKRQKEVDNMNCVFEQNDYIKQQIKEEKKRKIIEAGERLCSSCNQTRSLSDFDKKSQFSRQCKVCKKQKRHKWLQEGGKDKMREKRLAVKYNLTVEQVHEMLIAQNYRCKICSCPLNGNGNESNAPNIDHCHTTNVVRGILCGHCNRGLGSFRDNVEYLYAAIQYLNE